MACRPPEILAPPYRVLAPFESPERVPSGSIALISGMSELGEFQEVVAETVRLLPWVALAASVRRHESTGYYELAAQSLRASTGISIALVVPVAGMPAAPAGVLEAVARRRAIPGEQLGRWTAARLGRPDLVLTLGGAMGSGLPLVYPSSPRAMRRQLEANGLPPVADWKRLGDLAREDRRAWAGRGVGGQPRERIEQVTRDLRELAGIALRTWRERPGWEWVVERALRRWVPRMTTPTNFRQPPGPWALPAASSPPMS